MTTRRWTRAALGCLALAAAVACTDSGNHHTFPDAGDPNNDANNDPNNAPNNAPNNDEPDVDLPDADEPDADEPPVGPPDRDGDGVSDEDEAAAGTDPDLQDTDGDGFWDGWELAVGTDPLDPGEFPERVLPQGVPYQLAFTDMLEPAALRPLLRPRLNIIPPALLYFDGLTDGLADEVVIEGGIGDLVDNGVDEVPGNSDDRFAMSPSSISQINGQYLIRLEGGVVDRALLSNSAQIRVDLTGVTELTEGVSLLLESVVVEGRFEDGLLELTGVRLAGNLTRAGVTELAEQFSDILPLDPDLLLTQIDADGDGIIPVDFRLEGRRVEVVGFAEPDREVDPDVRGAEPCCPEGATRGEAVDPFLAAGVVDQGIQPDEEAMAQVAIEALVSDPEVHFVTTMRLLDGQFHYFVYGAGGWIEFVRQRGAEGTTYPIVAQEGDNPLAQDDPDRWSTLEELLTLEEANPGGTTYPDRGYADGDPRLFFLDPALMTFPFAYERIAALYDDPRAGDLTVTEVSWSGGGFSSHGQLGALQSRAPLLISGPGVRSSQDTGDGAGFRVVDFPGDADDPGAQALLLRDATARGVDIAPTIAAALGVAPHALAVRDGRFTDDALLAWQDGRVLEEVFTDEALARIQAGQPVAQRAIIIVNDGLTAVEINHELQTPGYQVAGYRRLAARGMVWRGGAITNWPSNTFPSHNMVGAGAYSGHHGLLDNRLYDRGVAAAFSPITSLFDTEIYFGSSHPNLPVETLFEAVHRTFGRFDGQGGVITASVSDPSSRGAVFASLERRRPEALVLPTPAATIEIGGRSLEMPEVGAEDVEGLVDNSSVFTTHGLWLGGGVPVPKFAILNFSSTDGAGHAFGPHSDHERELVIPRMNQRVEIVLAILEEAGVLDETLIVLTSDHGMEMKDASRRGSAGDRLAATGLRYLDVGGNIFFKRLHVEAEGAQGLRAGQETEVTFEVVDLHSLQGPTPLPVRGALVRVASGGQAQEVATDAQGRAVLRLTPDPGVEGVEVVVEESGFNPATVGLSVQP